MERLFELKEVKELFLKLERRLKRRKKPKKLNQPQFLLKN
jgi:hypothetical protein